MRVRTSTTDNYMKGSRSAERSFRVTVNHSKKDLDGYRINDSDFSSNEIVLKLSKYCTEGIHKWPIERC